MQLIKPALLLFIASITLIGCSVDDDNTPLNDPKSENNKPLGTAANDLLSATNYKSLTIEIVSVKGFEPTTQAVNNLTLFLQNRLYKPDGITIKQRSVSSSNLAPFSNEEIAQIETDTRTLFNAGDEITAYVYFADGSHEDDKDQTVTLGTAYKNTSMVIYEGTLRTLSSKPNSPELVTTETATLHHEFSHLLGLVNIGTLLQSNHEDPDAKGHCIAPGCLMEGTIEFGTKIMEKLGNGVPELDPQCIADLQTNGGR